MVHNSLFTTINPKRSHHRSLKTPQNHIHLGKLIIKTHPQSSPARSLCLERDRSLKLTTVKHFQLFFVQTGPRPNGASGRPKSHEIEKNDHSKNYETHKTAKKWLPLRFSLTAGMTGAPPNQKHPANPRKFLQMAQEASQITKNHNSDLATSRT